MELYNFNPGDVLLSHKVSQVVPLALEGLTAEFGMGSGVSPPLWSPENPIQQSEKQAFLIATNHLPQTKN